MMTSEMSATSLTAAWVVFSSADSEAAYTAAAASPTGDLPEWTPCSFAFRSSFRARFSASSERSRSLANRGT